MLAAQTWDPENIASKIAYVQPDHLEVYTQKYHMTC